MNTNEVSSHTAAAASKRKPNTVLHYSERTQSPFCKPFSRAIAIIAHPCKQKRIFFFFPAASLDIFESFVLDGKCQLCKALAFTQCTPQCTIQLSGLACIMRLVAAINVSERTACQRRGAVFRAMLGVFQMRMALDDSS